jgi:hypothetical protein
MGLRALELNPALVASWSWEESVSLIYSEIYRNKWGEDDIGRSVRGLRWVDAEELTRDTWLDDEMNAGRSNVVEDGDTVASHQMDMLREERGFMRVEHSVRTNPNSADNPTLRMTLVSFTNDQIWFQDGEWFHISPTTHQLLL